jgi:hypothetical protein
MADAYVGLNHAVVPALACAVQKKNNGPGFLFGEIGGNKDLVTIVGAGDCDLAIKESGLNAAEGWGNSTEEQEKE